MDNTKGIRTWLNAGLIAKLVQTALMLGIWAMRKPLLEAGNRFSESLGMKGVVRLAVLPVVYAAISLLVYLFLKSLSEQAPASERATAPLVVVLIVPLVLSVCSTAATFGLQALYARLYSADIHAEMSVLSTYQSFTGIFGTFTTLCFTLAAGMLYWRAKQAPQ